FSTGFCLITPAATIQLPGRVVFMKAELFSLTNCCACSMIGDDQKLEFVASSVKGATLTRSSLTHRLRMENDYVYATSSPGNRRPARELGVGRHHHLPIQRVRIKLCGLWLHLAFGHRRRQHGQWNFQLR